MRQRRSEGWDSLTPLMQQDIITIHRGIGGELAGCKEPASVVAVMLGMSESAFWAALNIIRAPWFVEEQGWSVRFQPPGTREKSWEIVNPLIDSADPVKAGVVIRQGAILEGLKRIRAQLRLVPSDRRTLYGKWAAMVMGQLDSAIEQGELIEEYEEALNA